MQLCEETSFIHYKADREKKQEGAVFQPPWRLIFPTRRGDRSVQEEGGNFLGARGLHGQFWGAIREFLEMTPNGWVHPRLNPVLGPPMQSPRGGLHGWGNNSPNCLG